MARWGYFFLAVGLTAGLVGFAAGFLPETAALKDAPAENFGTVVAAILRTSPVFGFLPTRAARLAGLNVPKPIRATSCPLATALVMIATSASIDLPAATFETSVTAASSSISSALLISWTHFVLESIDSATSSNGLD